MNNQVIQSQSEEEEKFISLDYRRMAQEMLDQAHANTHYADERYATTSLTLPVKAQFYADELTFHLAMDFAARVSNYNDWEQYRGFCLDTKTQGRITLDLLE